MTLCVLLREFQQESHGYRTCPEAHYRVKNRERPGDAYQPRANLEGNGKRQAAEIRPAGAFYARSHGSVSFPISAFLPSSATDSGLANWDEPCTG